MTKKPTEQQYREKVIAEVLVFNRWKHLIETGKGDAIYIEVVQALRTMEREARALGIDISEERKQRVKLVAPIGTNDESQ